MNRFIQDSISMSNMNAVDFANQTLFPVFDRVYFILVLLIVYVVLKLVYPNCTHVYLFSIVVTRHNFWVIVSFIPQFTTHRVANSYLPLHHDQIITTLVMMYSRTWLCTIFSIFTKNISPFHRRKISYSAYQSTSDSVYD